jgi:hypothetical protein
MMPSTTGCKCHGLSVRRHRAGALSVHRSIRHQTAVRRCRLWPCLQPRAARSDLDADVHFKFDRVQLKKASDALIAHGDLEHEQTMIRKSVLKLLAGQSALNVIVKNDGAGS